MHVLYLLENQGDMIEIWSDFYFEEFANLGIIEIIYQKLKSLSQAHPVMNTSVSESEKKKKRISKQEINVEI